MEPNVDAGQLARVLDTVRARRASGEPLTDSQILAANPGLAPQLAAELHKLEVIQRARRLASFQVVGHDGTAQPAPDSFPGYEIVRELHRGGQGVIYQAIQQSTGRQVAIKVMKEGPFADSHDRLRFEREVQVLSALKHSNIVSIQDSGAAAGLAYFVMDYIAGQPLDVYVRDRGCDVAAVLRLFVLICDAVHAAQLCGVIHRDLKPANILIDAQGVPHVLDFGLAKVTCVGTEARVGADGRPMLTAAGQFVGSLPWASPEQAEGALSNIDARTDVYSLGVILYQILCGRFPYAVTGSLRVVLGNIQNAAPSRPRSLRSGINDEVETIVLKCLQKDRHRRYESAGDLSGDLRRYLHGEPIDAKRDSRLYVLRKHLRRFWAPVAAILAVFASLVVGIIGTTRATWRAQRAEADAQDRATAESRLRERADWETYKACLAAADAALVASDSAMAKARLDAAPPALRGWEWRYLSSRIDQSLASYALPGPLVGKFALQVDGSKVLVARADGALLTIDLPTGSQRESIAVSGGDASCFALSPDGVRSAIGLHSGEICVRRTPDGFELLRFPAHAGPVWVVAFSPDGSLLASGAAGLAGADEIRLWDAATAQARGAFRKPESWVTALAFRPDGRMLASAHSKPSAGFRVWDLQSGQERYAVDFQGLDATHVEFSPDGALLAVASQDSSLKLYDAESGHEVRAFAEHGAGVNHVAFSPDGRRLASASADQSVRVWDVAGAAFARWRGHLNGVNQAVFLPNGDRLLSLCVADSTLKLWDAGGDDEPFTFDAGKYFVSFLAFSSDGRRLLSSHISWDTATGHVDTQLPARDGWELSMWIAPDPSVEWVVRSTDAAGAILRDSEPLCHMTEALRFGPVMSPDGDRIAFGLARGVIQVRAADDGRTIRELPVDPQSTVRATFSQDGATLLAWTNDGRWTTWDVASGRRLFTRTQGSQPIVNAAFGQDDRLLATASYDGTARIWDAATGVELRALRPSGAPAGDQSVIWSVAFSPDGTRLATGSKDRRIRLWDVTTGQELVALVRHAGTVMCLAWSPDGTQLASGGYDGSVCLWDSLPRAARRARAKASDSLPESVTPPDSE